MGKISVRPSAIILDGDKLLVVHSVYSGNEFYLLPGGGIEGNETIFECAVRETKEETGATVRAVKVAYANDYITADGRCLNIYILCSLVSKGDGKHSDDGGKVKTAEWRTLSELEHLDFRPKELIRRIKRDLPGFSSEDNFFVG